MRSIFVTGTDTGVGKTLVAAGLARLWANQGYPVGVFKPVASGGTISKDGKLLQRAARLSESVYPEIVPVHYRQPLAPCVAAWKEGAVPLARVEKAYRQARKRYDPLIVEGVGGVLVPITRDFFVTDWMVKWKLPVLVVARAGLGTLNHTLLTLEALKKRKVKVLGVIVNGYKGKDIAERTNVRALRKLCRVPVYGPLKFNARYRRNLDLLANELSKIGIKFRP